MFPARVVGRVVSTRQVDSLTGQKLLLVQPTTWEKEDVGEPFIAMDSVGAGSDEWILYVESREAALTLEKIPPIDAAVVAIIDGVDIDRGLL